MKKIYLVFMILLLTGCSSYYRKEEDYNYLSNNSINNLELLSFMFSFITLSKPLKYISFINLFSFIPKLINNCF